MSKKQNIKKMIKIIDIEVETGETIVYACVDAHESFLPLTENEIKENNEAISLLFHEMDRIGATMREPKKFYIENTWTNVNDGKESFLEWDFSDNFPEKEKKRIKALLSDYIND